jgi:hypothetical protein
MIIFTPDAEEEKYRIKIGNGITPLGELEFIKLSGDGTSITHSWNGTTLTVTSASGTSSADLKGEKGEQGIQGIQGEKGDKGETGPQGPQGESANNVVVNDENGNVELVLEATGNGLSSTAKSLLITILRNSVFTSN